MMDVDRRDFLKAVVAIPMALAQHVGAKTEVILCFDGSGPLDKWRRVLELYDKLAELTGSAHFTVYACGAQLVSKMPGSTIGAGGEGKEVEERLRLIQHAMDEGHEIGNHSVRHKNGRSWSVQQWYDELAEFDAYMARFFKDQEGKPYKPLGFRAPYLAVNDNMYRALERLDYSYDLSQVGDFTKKIGRIVAKGMPMYVRDGGKRILGMDYNWYIDGITDAELERMLSRYALSVKTNHIVISLHFSDYGHGNRNYFQTVSDFLMSLARKGGYQFVSMIDHLRAEMTPPANDMAAIRNLLRGGPSPRPALKVQHPGSFLATPAL
jgi:peptidoglycan/xylan/chitin deacetylase (PgdA/CDA1 family)